MNKENKIALSKKTYNQTQIEILLQIDDKGMTTAKNLYDFLDLDPKNYSRWCNQNILKNKFAIEDVDYIVFVVKEENSSGGRPSTDYKLTADFAKKLSMTGNSEKHEQARQYFLACEKGLKIASEKMNASNNNLEKSINLISEALTNISSSIATMQSEITQLKQTQRNKLPQKSYSRWKVKTFDKLNSLLSFICQTSDQDLNLQNIIRLIINETEARYDIDFNDYRHRFIQEYQDDNPYIITVVDHYPELKKLFTHTLDNYLDEFDINAVITDQEDNILNTLVNQKQNHPT